MTAPVHHRAFRIGLIVGLVAVCGFALVELLRWDGALLLVDVVGRWLSSPSGAGG